MASNATEKKPSISTIASNKIVSESQMRISATTLSGLTTEIEVRDRFNSISFYCESNKIKCDLSYFD